MYSITVIKLHYIFITPQTRYHVIIALYPDEASAKVASQFNFDWIRLLNYRSKIIWAYTQSRDLKQNIKDDFSTISDCVGELESNSYKNLDFKRLRRTLYSSLEST
jgi:hypothetical protein